MTRPFPLLFVALSVALTACVPHKQTGYLDIGNRVDFRQLVSQHGAPFGNADIVQLVLYADSMAASRMAHKVLSTYDPYCLNQGKVVFVGDISGMPAFIARVAAIPLMQSYPYPVWLDYDGVATKNIPVQQKQISMIDVEDGRLVAIGYAQTEIALNTSLARYCKPAAAL